MQINVRNLAHGFVGTSTLFEGLDFVLRAGDLVAVTGPSGSGKSTLLSLLAGWETPMAGKVQWDKIESVGWVFQNPHGDANRTSLDHVSLPLIAKGIRRRQASGAALKIMHRFGLEDLATQRFGTISGGEAQRLMLARAVAKAPSLLLVDEPTASLDPVAAATVNTVLGELAMDQAIVVVATHDPATRAACRTHVDLGRVGSA
jgi:ABC-type lipoprotein export system ATPase subunit